MKRVKLLFLMCINLAGFGQEFEKGKIIKTNGETVEGFVADNRLSQMNAFCHFKTSSSSEEYTQFLPSEIKSFEVSNKIYESIEFDNEGTPKKIFAFVLVKGKASLYQYADGFLIAKGNQVQIVQKPKQIREGERYVEKQFYLYQLDELFSDCISRYTFMKNIEYSTLKLAKAVELYNQCQGEQTYVIQKVKTKPHIGFNAFFGAGELTAIYDGNNLTTTGAGLSMQFTGDPLMNKSLISVVEVNVVNYKIEDLNTNLTFINPNILLRYAFGGVKDGSFPYAEGGISANKRIAGTGRYTDANGVGMSVPVGLGYQTAITKKIKMNIGARYFQFVDPTAYRLRNFVGSVGLVF